MKTIVIELINDKAEELLNSLEAMDIIRITNESTNVESTAKISSNKPLKPKPSDFIGVLSKKEGEEYLKFIHDIRNEWDRDI
jgi:hypothetical protein